MKYIVDIKDTVTDEEFAAWIASGNHIVNHSFDHFKKTYLIETDSEIVPSEIVESVMVDNDSTALKLLLAPTFTVDTTNDDNWWKSIVIHDALSADTPEVYRFGSGYAVYLMDSGVNDTHSDFSNTSIRHLFSHTSTNNDTNGHGTALASLISGTVAGITSAEIVSVKIFESGTITLMSDLLRGLDAIASDYIRNYPSKPAIVNLSWGINKDEYVEAKIKSMIDLGLVFVVAAGNSGIPIENVTPAGITEVLTVGSINTNLEPSDFSDYTGSSSISLTNNETNYAPGLDYWAPGEHILAANKSGGFSLTAGTSAAAAICSATLIYNFAKLELEFGKEYKTYSAATDGIDGISNIITMTRASLKDGILNSDKNSLFLKSKPLVALPEKYKMCPNSVPVIRGLKIAFEPTQYFKNLSALPISRTMTYIRKNEPVRIDVIIQPEQIDSCSFSGLPNGLSLEGNTLVGAMTDDLAGERFKVYNATLTLVRGIETLDISFQIIQVDPALLTDSFTSVDYQNEMINSGLILRDEFYDPCPDCYGNTAYCDNTQVCIYDQYCTVTKGYYGGTCTP